MSKNVAVFVDVANIFYAAKAAGVDIDYVTLLKSATANRDLVRAYAYTGLDPENENQRNFHSFLARSGYRVVSKDIRKYGDGKVKANLDIELVVDMMKTARNLDIAIVVSGDGDFAPAIRAVQEQGVRVEVISFRGNTSSDLMDVADLFTDITHLAKVERGSRSGRRVAGDDEDLSMTEVPDKQTEGTGAGRGRGRGRERTRGREVEPVTRVARGRRSEPAVALTSSGAPLVVLPGEKLSRVAPVEMPAAILGDDDEAPIDAAEALSAGRDGAGAETDENGDRRRRRRRGGRGRGRGRGRGEGGEAGDIVEPGEVGETGQPAAIVEPGEPQRIVARVQDVKDADVDYPVAPRGPRTTPFGSVWDSQLGVPSSSPAGASVPPLADDEDFDEPEIPEYLIAEQRRNRVGGGGGGAGRGPGGPGGARGGRGNRAGYAAAVDRERYGRGGGGGINRYPDVSGRERPPRDAGYGGRQDRPPRPERQDRQDRPAPRGAGGGGDPWSEVPPEIEEMLRAQLAQGRPRGEPVGGRPSEDRAPAPPPAEVVAPDAVVSGETTESGTEAAPKRRATTRRKAATPDAVAGTDSGAGVDEGAIETPAPKRRTAARRSTKAVATDLGSAETAASADDAEAEPTTRRRTTRRTASATTAAGDDTEAAATPKPRATRRKASTETPSA